MAAFTSGAYGIEVEHRYGRIVATIAYGTGATTSTAATAIPVISRTNVVTVYDYTRTSEPTPVEPALVLPKNTRPYRRAPPWVEGLAAAPVLPGAFPRRAVTLRPLARRGCRGR